MAENPEQIKMLLVDDEEEFLLSSSRALARRGFEVDVAANGVTALEKIEQNSYDVVVLDVKMPDIDGIEVFLQIHKKLPDLPVILLTGHGSLEDAFQTAKAGIADYLAKPVDIDVLAEKVRKAMTKVPKTDLTKTASSITENIRVMLVDDEIDFLTGIKKVLDRRRMEVITADSGEKALSLLKENPIDIIVLDLKMPGMDGIEALKRVKQAYPGIEVIILTGHPTVESALEVIRLGANEYLKKPPQIEELTATIRRLYENRQQSLHERRQKLIEDIRRRYPE
jgi:DNA-binding NtrC family response regulator